MALQLIYTSAERLLDSGQSGYGVVARSEVMPREMQRKLTEISRYRSVPASRADTVQCAYSTLTHGNSEYHVLTVTQAAGADYSGRLCYISHHLVLLPEEVSALLRNKYRPTPAGVILALHKRKFWQNQWSAPPQYIKGEPHLSPQDIPEADKQNTWKRLTGHKSNARAFSTPPFERDCLMTVPADTSTADILRLWHESDWLTPGCGWGKTFITHADEADNFRVSRRWACSEESLLIRKAMRTGHPILPIGPDLEIGEISDDTQAATPGLPLTVTLPAEEAANFRAQLSARQAARVIPPYQYFEEPDEEIFDLSDIRKKKSRRRIAAVTLAFLLLAGGGISGTLFYINRTPARIGGQAAYRSLRVLLSQPYRAGLVAQELEKIDALAKASRTANSAQNQDILQIIDLIRQASEAEKHAANLRRLCKLAAARKLDKNKLCLLYMMEATHNRPVDEWFRSFSREEISEWERLITEEPELRSSLNEPGLLAYFDKVMNKQLADNKHQNTSSENAAGAESCGEHFIPVITNEELPEAFIKLLQSAPFSLAQGEVTIIRVPWDSAHDSPEKIPLNPKTNTCTIVRSAVDDYYHLRFANPTNAAVRTHPDLDICVRHRRLVSISSGGNAVAATIPLGTAQLLLMPKPAIPLSGIHAPELPPADEVDFNISPHMLRVIPPSANHMSVSLQLISNNRFPWTSAGHKSPNQKFTLSLPNLSEGNIIQPPEIPEATPVAIKWDGAEISGGNKNFTTFTCKLTPQSDIGVRLEATFNRITNSGCAGEVSNADPMFSLAMVYTTLQLMDKDGITEEEWNSACSRYCTLFNNKTFCDLMQRVAPDAQDILLSHGAASSRSAAGNSERRSVLIRLRNQHNRERLTSAILRFISGQLRATYQEIRHQLTGDTELRLVLRKLSCRDNKLVWHFVLQPVSDTNNSSHQP